jgi:WD40 repeat protein
VYLWDTKTGNLIARFLPGTRDGSHEFVVIPYYFATVPYARLCYWTPTGLEVQDDLAKPARRPIRLKGLRPAVEKEGWPVFPMDGEGTAPMGHVYFSADDKYLAAVRGEKSVHIWNARTGEHVGRFALPEGAKDDPPQVHAFAFDPTSRYLAAAVSEAMPHGVWGALIVWDLKTGKKMLHAKEKYSVLDVVFSPKGELICGEAGVHPDGVDAPGRITIREAGAFFRHRSIYTPRGLSAIAIVPRVGLVTGDFGGEVLLWDIEAGADKVLDTGKLLAVATEHGKFVSAIAVGQGGKIVASGDFDGMARLWKIAEAPSRNPVAPPSP